MWCIHFNVDFIFCYNYYHFFRLAAAFGISRQEQVIAIAFKFQSCVLYKSMIGWFNLHCLNIGQLSVVRTGELDQPFENGIKCISVPRIAFFTDVLWACRTVLSHECVPNRSATSIPCRE